MACRWCQRTKHRRITLLADLRWIKWQVKGLEKKIGKIVEVAEKYERGGKYGG